MYRQYMFEQKYENSEKIKLKIVIFTAVKSRCILHGRVFVMIFMQNIFILMAFFLSMYLVYTRKRACIRFNIPVFLKDHKS